MLHAFLPLFIIFGLLVTYVRRRRHARTVAFFHPYCNAGGGGERVLWCAVRCVANAYPDWRVVVYTGDTDATLEHMVEKAQQRFNVDVRAHVHRLQLVYLRYRWLVDARYYPVFTLIGQSIGGLLLGVEAMVRGGGAPEVYIDSMGYAFTLPLFRYIGASRTGVYVHYPTISTDMLSVVADRTNSFNNSGLIASSPLLSRLKLIYYHAFAWLYACAGRCSQLTMVNSTWTRDHIASLWRPSAPQPHIVYPPVDTDAFAQLTNISERLLKQDGVVRLLSIGQFRPEKDHRLQLDMFAEVLHRRVDKSGPALTLVLAGSCRHDEDIQRVEALRLHAQQLGIEHRVEWQLNIPFDKLCDELSHAFIGVHTMYNEHFGIGIVEGMCAGNIMIAHDSGGPRADILPDGAGVGFRAHNVDTYAAAVVRILDTMTVEQRDSIRRAARERACTLFSDAVFDAQLRRHLPLIFDGAQS